MAFVRPVTRLRAGNSSVSGSVHREHSGSGVLAAAAATVAGAGTVSNVPAVEPTYTPLKAWSAAGGTLNANISGWDWATRATYSNDISSPFGANRVAKFGLVSNSNSFGGGIISNLGSLNIGDGDDLWIRLYHYFPAGFCFSCSTVEGDRWGSVKWYRVEFTNGNRFTAQMGKLAGTAMANAPTCGTQAGWGGATDEYGGGGANMEISDPPLQVTRGQWLALQTHIKFSSGNSGYVESWINDTYIGRCVKGGSSTSYRTCPSNGSPVDFILLGDYWNGAPGFDQAFYIDEVIITTETPNTVDADGRPYIAPTTRVADFS